MIKEKDKSDSFVFGLSKHEREIACFKHAITCLAVPDNNIGEFDFLKTAAIITRHNENNASPDIVLFDGRTGEYIGVEHFEVNQASAEIVSKTGDKKMAITEKPVQKELRKLYEKGHEELLETESISDELAKMFIYKLVDYANKQVGHPFSNILSHYNYVLEKHCERINNYKDEMLQSLPIKKDPRVGFLIDISFRLFDASVFDGNTFHRYYSGEPILLFDFLIPFIFDYCEKPDFIIFAFRDTGDHIVSAIVLSISDIVSYLRLNKPVVYMSSIFGGNIYTGNTTESTDGFGSNLSLNTDKEILAAEAQFINFCLANRIPFICDNNSLFYALPKYKFEEDRFEILFDSILDSVCYVR